MPEKPKAKDEKNDHPQENNLNDIHDEDTAFDEEEEENLFEDEVEEEDEFDLVEGALEEKSHDEIKKEIKKEKPQPALKDDHPHPEAKEAPKKAEPIQPHVVTPELHPEMIVNTSSGGELRLSDIPVTLTVELAQLQMSVQHLLELKAGNMLELQRNEANTLLLVANGKIIGKGEIIKIGDTLGVRVLEIGSQSIS